MTTSGDSITTGGNAVETTRIEDLNNTIAMDTTEHAHAVVEKVPDGADASQPKEPIVASTSTESEIKAEKTTTAENSKAAAETPAAGQEDGPEPSAKEKDADDDAIGPAQDEIKTVTSDGADSAPVCNITLLLTSGSRHPYRIDAKYLSRRNVSMPDETEAGHPDPFSISIYTLKELILREWRADWESKPASPSSIRLIHFGKLLDDKEQLKSKSPHQPEVSQTKGTTTNRRFRIPI